MVRAGGASSADRLYAGTSVSPSALGSHRMGYPGSGSPQLADPIEEGKRALLEQTGRVLVVLVDARVGEEVT